MRENENLMRKILMRVREGLPPQFKDGDLVAMLGIFFVIFANTLSVLTRNAKFDKIHSQKLTKKRKKNAV